jgi:hypothetical protein
MALDQWLLLQLKQRVVMWGDDQSTHEGICSIIENIKLRPNISMTHSGKEILLNQLPIFAAGFCKQ